MEEGEGSADKPRMILIINHISKKNNVRTLITSSAAFGAHEIVIVGQHKLDTSTHVPPAFRDKITLTRYESLEVCREALHSRGFKIYGVEISSDAKDINDEPFDGSAAFIMGNEGSGMSKRQVSICDGLIYIPQYGRGTASLNVAVAASIVMHRYSLWSQGQGFTNKIRKQEDAK